MCSIYQHTIRACSDIQCFDNIVLIIIYPELRFKVFKTKRPREPLLCLSICLSVCLSVCLFVCLSVCLSIYLSVCLSVCLFDCLSVCLSVCLCVSVYLSVCLSVFLSVCRSVCLSATPAVSGVRGADEQQKNKFGLTYFAQSKSALCDRTVEFCSYENI